MRTISTSVSNADSAYVHWQKQLEPAVTHWGGRCYETGTRGVECWGTQQLSVNGRPRIFAAVMRSPRYRG